MVWENGCTVIVMLTPLVEDGVKQCDRYWPDEGSSLYHIYEVRLTNYVFPMLSKKWQGFLLFHCGEVTEKRVVSEVAVMSFSDASPSSVSILQLG